MDRHRYISEDRGEGRSHLQKETYSPTPFLQDVKAHKTREGPARMPPTSNQELLVICLGGVEGALMKKIILQSGFHSVMVSTLDSEKLYRLGMDLFSSVER